MDITLAKSAVFDRVTNRDSREEKDGPHLNGNEGVPLIAPCQEWCYQHAAAQTWLVNACYVVSISYLCRQVDQSCQVCFCPGVWTCTPQSQVLVVLSVHGIQRARMEPERKNTLQHRQNMASTSRPHMRSLHVTRTRREG